MSNITNEQLLKATKPLIELINEEHPHHTIIVTHTGAELLEGQVCCRTEEFLKD